jgi:heat shock protein HspQ
MNESLSVVSEKRGLIVDHSLNPRSNKKNSKGEFTMATVCQAKFAPGHVVEHRDLRYRAVVLDVDPRFLGREDWYPQDAFPAPDRDQPWYRLLVDGHKYQTYVPESVLRVDDLEAPVEHLSLRIFFKGYESGRYQPRWLPN